MVIIHRNETHNTWCLTRVKTIVKFKSFTFDVTIVDMNGLNRYLYVYNAPSIGMDKEEQKCVHCEARMDILMPRFWKASRYCPMCGNWPHPWEELE